MTISSRLPVQTVRTALTQNSAYRQGFPGVRIGPLVVFGLWGGAWADAMDRRLLLIMTFLRAGG